MSETNDRLFLLGHPLEVRPDAALRSRDNLLTSPY